MDHRAKRTFSTSHVSPRKRLSLGQGEAALPDTLLTHGAKLWNRHVKIMVHYGHVYKTHARREIQINVSSNT